jgi:RNA polymerase sigma-70 factor (ECF subfamily)
MATGEPTSWSLIEGAAAGSEEAREVFARRYGPVLGAYFAARWRGGGAQDVEDAVQEALLECFRAGGALEKAEPRGVGGFRAFLYGVARNVALRVEKAQRNRARWQAEEPDLDQLASEDTSLSTAFDRAWAGALVQEAAVRHEERARAAGEDAWRRFELLGLHFRDGIPLNEIAERWGLDAGYVYKQHRVARAEFKEALLEVLSFHSPGSTRGELERECAQLPLMLD